MGKQRTARIARKTVHELINRGTVSTIEGANSAYEYLKKSTPQMVSSVYEAIVKERAELEALRNPAPANPAEDIYSPPDISPEESSDDSEE